MDKLPYKIKKAIRRYAKAQIEAATIYEQIQSMMEEYNVPIDNLLACGDTSWNAPPQTEALAYINNCECDDIEGTISDIEEIFLWFVNNQQGNYTD